MEDTSSFSKEKRFVYTVGHSNRSLEAFISILKKYGIEVVIDVRRFPMSRKYPWFNREEMCKALANHGIKYIWLGDLLGGYRNGGYEKYMETDDFRVGIKKLLDLIQKYTAAIVCCEKFWFRCHRRFISDILKGLSFNVIHIIDNDKVYTHKRERKYRL